MRLTNRDPYSGDELDVYLEPGHTYTIGRALDASIRIRHASMSRHHAELSQRPDGVWWVRDLGSSNGVFINDVQVEEGALASGDTLRFGDFAAQVRELHSVEQLRLSAESGGALRAPEDPARAMRGVTVTPSFVFVTPDPERPVRDLPGFEGGARIVSRFGDRVALPHEVLPPAPLRLLKAAVITTDRALYHAYVDQVAVVLYAPHLAAHKLNVEVRRGRAHLDTVPVVIGEHGLGRLVLTALSPGEYTVATAGVTPASFVVVHHELAPLVAELVTLRRDRDLLYATLRLTSLGGVVRDPVRVELRDHGRRVSLHETEPSGELLEVELEMRGDGPFTLQITVVDDPTRTASVPLPGTEREDREALVVSKLGPSFYVTRLPEAGSVEVRGLHVGQRPGGSAPVALAHVVGRVASLRVTQACAVLAVVVIDLVTGHADTRTFADLAPGASFELELPRAPMVGLVLGALYHAEARLVLWEDAAVMFTPGLSVELELPAARPHQPFQLAIRAPWAGSHAAAWVVVRDARVPPASGLGDGMASALMVHADRWRAVPAHRPALEDEDDTWNFVAVRRAGRAPDEPSTGSLLTSVIATPRGTALFRDVVSLVDGVAVVDLLAPDELDLCVEVFVADGAEYACASRNARLEGDAFVHLELGASLRAGEYAIGHARVRTPVPAHLEVWRGDVCLRLDLEPGRHDVPLELTPGEWRASLTAAGEVLAEARAELAPLGITHALVVTPHPLELGEEVRADAIEGCEWLALHERPWVLRDLFTAVANYPHGCPEQTAATLVAWGGLYTVTCGPERRRARDVLVTRLTWLLRGGRWDRWGEYTLSPRFGGMAAIHLLSLIGLGIEDDPELVHLLREARATAIDALTAASELERSAPTSWAWARLCAGRDQARALSVARAELANPRHASGVSRRASDAYAAAVMLCVGDEADRIAATRKVRDIAAYIGVQARLHSSTDSGAFVAALCAMKGPVGGSARVDGVVVAVEEALAPNARVIGAVDGPLVVAVARRVREDLAALTADSDIHAWVAGPRKAHGPLYAGEGARLEVMLEPYREGDCLQIELPPSVCMIIAGARVYRYELDLALLPRPSRDRVTVPVLALGPTHRGDGASQTGFVLLRNMYDERRVARAELTVRVEPLTGWSASSPP